jgi:PBSX family phage terminase large subunit
MATTESPSAEPLELGPFAEQEPFLQREKKYYGYVSGVGAGKTFAGILRTALNMESWNQGEMGAIVAPTNTMVKDVIITEMRNLGFMDHWDYRSQHTEQPGIHGPDGSRALILSADNQRTIERLRGLNLAWWWIDEEAEVNERARDILTQRLRVGNYRNGFITTTPKGRNHTYGFFVDGVDGERSTHGQADLYTAEDRLAILRVPSHANPHTPEDYKAQLDRDHEGQFYEQEVLGDFVDFEGLIYPWFDDDTHVLDSENVPEPGEYDEVIYGVDWGHNNPATIVALVNRGEQWVAVDEWYERRCTVNDHSRALEDMQDHWGTGAVYCDPSEPANIETFHRDGISARKGANDVTPGIQHVTSLRNEFRVAPTCQNLRNEFSQYRYKDDGESDDPVKQNDHALDGTRYALFTHLATGTVTRRTPGSAGKRG